MAKKRTKKERIETLEERLDWLRRKVARYQADGLPYSKYSFLTDEITALEWVLPMARKSRTEDA